MHLYEAIRNIRELQDAPSLDEIGKLRREKPISSVVSSCIPPLLAITISELRDEFQGIGAR
jgi:hypothetical protein